MRAGSVRTLPAKPALPTSASAGRTRASPGIRGHVVMWEHGREGPAGIWRVEAMDAAKLLPVPSQPHHGDPPPAPRVSRAEG